MSSNYLFIFTIGPVQSYISAARKTKDMKAGSKMLSDIIKEVVEQHFLKEELIFPNTDNPSMPNRVLAIVQEDDINEFGKQVTQTALEFYKNKSESEQIANFLKCHWAVVPLTNDYKADYVKLESLLGATKNIRQFQQLQEEGKVCSVCGERVAKHFSNGKNNLAKNEVLCDVCMAKRNYLKKGFPSTADIAMMHIVDLIEKDESNKKLLNPFENNGQLYFEENLNEKYFKENGLLKDNGIDETKLEDCKTNLKEILKLAKNNDLKQTKYYALMAFDGDSMGSWLSGEYIKEGQLKEFHKALTQDLGEFAKHVNEKLIAPRGRTIYAGGEDFIGFINLKYLFEVMENLRIEFKKQVNDKLNEFFKNDTDEISFSAGIAIAHYKHDLQDVVGQARRMEKLAKTSFDDTKNAFAITILKSDATETTWQWGEKNGKTTETPEEQSKTTETITHLKTILEQLKVNFSSTYMETLYKEFEPLIDFKSGKLKVKNEMFEFELNRLVQRSFMGSQKEKEAEVKKLLESLGSLFNATRTKKHTGYVNNFFSMLETIDFLSKEIHL